MGVPTVAEQRQANETRCVNPDEVDQERISEGMEENKDGQKGGCHIGTKRRWNER